MDSWKAGSQWNGIRYLRWIRNVVWMLVVKLESLGLEDVSCIVGVTWTRGWCLLETISIGGTNIVGESVGMEESTWNEYLKS